MGKRDFIVVQRNIKALLKRRGLRYKDIAVAIGLSTSTFKKLMGVNGRPLTVDEVVSIARYLRVDIGEILEGVR